MQESPEQKQNEFRKIITRQIQEYALGIDPGISVEVSPLEMSSDRFSYGLKFVFRYNGEESVFTDPETDEKTLPVAEKELNDFYRKQREFRA